ncbi:MAG: hypothetical protein ACRC1Z_03965 [Waterburya sp.]
MHAHLERGGTTFGFIQLLKKRGYQLTHDSTVTSPISYGEDLNQREPTISLNPTALVNVIETVVKRIVPQSTRRLTYLEELESAYQNGWLLSTSEVSDLLGLTSKTIASYGQEFSDAGFLFTRAGTRKGGEIAWSIDKQSDWTRDNPSSTKAIQAAFSDQYDPE